MGISTNSKVAFICAADESNWAQPFLDAFKKPTKGSALGYESLDVPGAGFWEHEMTLTVPIAKCEVRDGGKVIVLETDYYGIICPARMDLPASVQAVVCTSVSCQDEPQDPLFAVLANDIRSTDFSDEADALKPFWFGGEELSEAVYRCLDYSDAKPAEEITQSAFKQLSSSYHAAFEQLLTEVKARGDLTAPFADNPELATIAGYLNSIDHPEADPEWWTTDSGGTLIPPSLDYTSTNFIGLKHKPTAADVFDGHPIAEYLKQAAKLKAELEAAEADRTKAFAPLQVGMSREEYIDAYRSALAGETDVTGIVKVIQSLELPPNSDAKLKKYLLQRLQIASSPVGQKLVAATDGGEVEFLVRGIFGNGKWNNVKLDDEEKEKKMEPQEETDELTDTFNDAMDGCTFDEVFSRANEFEQLIRENIQEIADNFNSENPFTPSGYEEPWLVGLLMKSGALFEADLEEEEDDDDDEDEVVEKNR